MLKGNNLRLARRITKKVIEKVPTATAWIFSALLEMGAVTIEAFLNPSLYADPSVSLWENFESQKLKSKKKPKFKETAVKQNLWRLRKQGFVEKKGDKYILTKMGRVFIEYILNRKRVINKKWDGKHRVVIFDIPEKQSKVRDWLRQELCLLKYQRLQKSVFVGKYPLPADLIKEIKSAKIGNCVNYILAEKVYKNIIR